MKTKLLFLASAAALVFSTSRVNAQAPTLGTTADFVLFSSNGAVSNTGISQYTGNIGSNNGSSTAFGNVNGTMHDMDGASAKCMADLNTLYNQLNGTTATLFPAALLGNGQVLNAGVYSIASAATLNLSLTLDGQNSSNAVFIIKIGGSFSTNASAKVHLVNGAQACNVYWKVEGLVSMASGTLMRGTVIANNAAISMATGDTLEGRALSTKGAVSASGTLAYTPIGCGSPVLTGPTAPTLGGAACFGIFSSSGAVSNSGITHITGDVGSNSASPTGFNPADVTGMIHNNPDGATAQCASDLLAAYNQLNNLVPDIKLLYPAQFGQNLVLTPHTYLMAAAATLTDTLYLNAEGNASAVFVIQIAGALSTTVNSKVILINGTKAENVFWKIEGAVNINNNSIFNGTIICNNGALGVINTGVTLNGRALTTAGALSSAAITAVAPLIPGNCGTLGIQTLDNASNSSVSIYPNPFKESFTLSLTGLAETGKTVLVIYNILGAEMKRELISNQTTVVETAEFASGVYFYKIFWNDKIQQAGKIVAYK